MIHRTGERLRTAAVPFPGRLRRGQRRLRRVLRLRSLGERPHRAITEADYSGEPRGHLQQVTLTLTLTAENLAAISSK